MGRDIKKSRASDSPLEKRRFEPSVPRDTTKFREGLMSPLLGSSPTGSDENRHHDDIRRLPRDRWFESDFLQRRVISEPCSDLRTIAICVPAATPRRRCDIGRYKRVIGDALRSRTGGRQTTEVTIAVASLNRMLEFGRAEYVRLS